MPRVTRARMEQINMDAMPEIRLPRPVGVSIHPAAMVDPAAVLGRDVRIGPFCTVGPDVVIEDGAELVSHVVVDGHTRIGEGAILYPFCTVGLAPQDMKYRGEPTGATLAPGRKFVSIARSIAVPRPVAA